MQHQNTQDARLQHLAMLSQLMNQGQQQAPHQPDIMASLASLYGMSREQQLLPAQLQGLQLANQKEQAGLAFLPQQQQLELASGQAKISSEGAAADEAKQRTATMALQGPGIQAANQKAQTDADWANTQQGQQFAGEGARIAASNAAAGASTAEMGWRNAMTASLPDKTEATKDRALGSSIMFAELAKQMGWTPDQAQAYRDKGILPGVGDADLNMTPAATYESIYGPGGGAYGQPGATPPITNAGVIGHQLGNTVGLLGLPFRQFLHGLNSPAGQPIQPLPLWPQ